MQTQAERKALEQKIKKQRKQNPFPFFKQAPKQTYRK